MPKESYPFNNQDVILKPYPDPFREKYPILTNGESKRYAAIAAGIPVHRPDKHILAELDTIEALHEAQYDNKGVVHRGELHNGEKLPVPYSAYVAYLKASGLVRHLQTALQPDPSYWESHDYLPGKVPKKFMVTDTTATVGNFACNKPENPEEEEALIDLWNRGQAQGLPIGYQTGLAQVDFTSIERPSLRLFSVHTQLGIVRPDINFGPIEQLLKVRRKSTGGMHFNEMFQYVIENSSGITHTTISEYGIESGKWTTSFVGGRIVQQRGIEIPTDENLYPLYYSLVRGFINQNSY